MQEYMHLCTLIPKEIYFIPQYRSYNTSNMTKRCAPDQFSHASFRKLRRIRSFFGWAVWCRVFLISISKDTNSSTCVFRNIRFF